MCSHSCKVLMQMTNIALCKTIVFLWQFSYLGNAKQAGGTFKYKLNQDIKLLVIKTIIEQNERFGFILLRTRLKGGLC
jgi:hypothetical protein